MKRIIVLTVSVILALVVAAPTMVFAADNSPVVPPHKGHYAKLSKEWWKWAYSVPASENPLADATETDGSKCAAGQPAAGKRGGVWFLGGLFTAPGEPFPAGGHVERTCDVPSGRSIFFPIFNTECSTVESNPPLVNPNGTPIPSAKADVDTLRKCAKYAIDWGLGLLPAGEPPGTGEHKLASLNASIDGVPISNLSAKNTPFRVASGPFKFTLVKNSIDTFCLSGDPNAKQYVQCPAGTSRAAADGVYLRLDPLSAGPHTIRFGGSFFDGGFPLDVTYHINQG